MSFLPTRRQVYLAGTTRFSKPRYANLIASSIAHKYSARLGNPEDRSAVARAMAEGEELKGTFTSVEDATYAALRKLENNFTKDELRRMARLRNYTTSRAFFEQSTERSTLPQRDTESDASPATERKKYELIRLFAKRTGRPEGLGTSTTFRDHAGMIDGKTPDQVDEMYRRYFDGPQLRLF